MRTAASAGVPRTISVAARAGGCLLSRTAVVALALVAQATDFKGPFVALTIVLLSVVCYIGATTVIRVGQPAVEELTWIAEMNRSRAA